MRRNGFKSDFHYFCVMYQPVGFRSKIGLKSRTDEGVKRF